MGFNLIYWTPMGGFYILISSILEKCGIFLKNGRFSGRIWPDLGNVARADLAGLGSIGLIYTDQLSKLILKTVTLDNRVRVVHSYISSLAKVLIKKIQTNLHIPPTQAAFHVGPGWAPIGPSWAQVGPRLGLTGAHLGMLLGNIHFFHKPRMTIVVKKYTLYISGLVVSTVNTRV